MISASACATVLRFFLLRLPVILPLMLIAHQEAGFWTGLILAGLVLDLLLCWVRFKQRRS